MRLKNSHGIVATDDGTDVKLSLGTTKLLNVNKSTGDVNIAGGLNDNQSL